jgi:predicted nucleic acid-binding protein
LKAYLDTSVINIYIFGRYSDIDGKRLIPVKKLFKLINNRKIHALVSLYTVQEIYSFCKKVFPREDVGHIAKNAIAELFKNKFELVGMLTREERLLHSTRFILNDQSDQPHAISAYLNNCNAIITYDTHFKKIESKISIYTPEEVILI